MKVLLSSIHQKRLHPGLHIADDWANLRQEHILADGFLPRDTCMSAPVLLRDVCPSCWLSRLCIVSKRVIVLYQTLWQYYDGNP